MASCAVTSVIAKDPRFQDLKKAYQDKHYSYDHLAQCLQLCRERHGYDDDWFPVTPARKAVFTRFMNHYLPAAKLAKTSSTQDRDSLYNLYSTLYGLYTPEQLENRIGMIANHFREMVDRYERNDNFGRSRQEIIKEAGDDKVNGFVKIMNEVFKLYERRYASVDAIMERFDKKHPDASETERKAHRKKAEHIAQEYRTILANKERLSALVAIKVGEEEGFVVNIRDFNVSFDELTEEEQLKNGDDNNQETTQDDKTEGSKGDRYGDFRVLKLMNTLGPRARRLISRIPKVDSSGKIIRDDLGATQYIGGRQVATVLKRVLVNSTPDSIMMDLEGAVDFYPWIRGLINELRKNPDEIGTVYSNFKNSETTYVYVDFEKSRYTPKIANSRSAGRSLMREAGTNLRSGYVLDDSTSIYTGMHGALKSLEEIQRIKAEFDDVRKRVQDASGTLWIRIVDGDAALSEKLVNRIIKESSDSGKDASHLRLRPVEAMESFLKSNPDIPKKLASFLRGMGFAVSESDVITIASQPMRQKSWRIIAGASGKDAVKGRNKLYQLVEFMSAVYGRAEQIYKSNLTATGQYLYNTSGAFSKINSVLALSKYNEVEDRVVNEGKSLSTYNNVNLLHQVFDGLMNKEGMSEDNYQTFLMDEYLRYEGMASGFGDNIQPHGWLRMFRDNEGGIRQKARVIDIAAFNHVEYADLSREQKLTNSLIMFLEGGRTFQDESYAAYEVPIQADYSTAYNFILAPRLKEDVIIDELTNEVLMELDRIAAIEARLGNDDRIKLSVYEEQGVRFQIFPRLNDTDFRERYTSIEDAEEAKAFVRATVLEEINDIVSKDISKIDESGILTNPAFKKVNFGFGNKGSLFTEKGVSSLDEKAQAVIREFSLNVFYARQQITKILVGGTEQFNGLVDFEKRNMLTHATRSSLYTKATWNGKRVGKDTQNVVYVEDDESASAFIDSIKEMLQQLLDEKVISKAQFNTMLKSYSKIKTTDGQGFRTLESYRAVQIMANQWDDEHERAFNNIIHGRPSKRDIGVFMQNIKPVLTGYEAVQPVQGETQKPVKLTVLHKYSEAVLLPLSLSQYCLQNQSVPLQAFDKAQKRLKKQGKEIDMFLFHSGVKVGAHSIIQPFAKKEGERLLKDARSIEDYIVSSILGKDAVVHTLPFKYYGIAASTPAHVADDKISWASQAEKVAWANVTRGQKIRVGGRVLDAWEARELYFDIKTVNIVEAYKKIREFFTDSDKLERVFQEELATKSYYSRDLQYALAHLKDGTFAVPLFSPNVEHQVQELLSSIIKKRLTKPKLKGANILQATGLGIDTEVSAFDNNNALSEDDKLRVEFEGSGSNKRIKYVEVYMPIHDSRLLMFADKDGNIGPERLRKLIDEGVIPESILEFIAYRTPSDAEHSVIPCRIKGFVANTGGATIMMPKEVMVMTGHDYDGDKMRCHFKDFSIVDKDDNEINLSDSDVALIVLGKQPANQSFKKVKVYEYDYDKPAIENTPKARNNARIDLMFAELTSPAGSRRMIIPGGCDETKVIAKSLFLVRSSSNAESAAKIIDAFVKDGMNPNDAIRVVTNTNSLYDTLIRKSDGELSDIIRVVSGVETPYSAAHSVDSFEYIMGGSQMIGVYATYNSALQMLQRLDMSYVPALTKKGSPYIVTMFGHTFGKLFDVRNHNGRLASLGLARLLNAAVDNNKDPVLGYLNQTKEMSELTFLMFAAGLTEEEIHLVMNQPSVIELINRLKSRDSLGMTKEILGLIDELAGNSPELGKISSWVALDRIKKMGRESFVTNLAMTHSMIKNGSDLDAIESQIVVLQTLRHLYPAAENLSKFVRLTRPESESGSIGTSVADIIVKEAELNRFRELLAYSDDHEIRISGMRDVLEKRDVHEGWDTSYIEEILGSNLPEVVALNSLMLDSSLDMFKPLFPQARDSWVELASSLASEYSYKKIQEGIVAKIGQEMILWKLLSNKKFVNGDPQEEQRRIIIDVPKQVKDLKERIAKAQNNPGKDKAAEALIGNAFLNDLGAISPENSESTPRLRFNLNGAPVEGTRDLISAYWGEMLNSEDKSIRDLAVDLFKYNLYTNGFSYGMYEFAHFAPFSLLMYIPGYIEALQDVLKTDWKDENERKNFIHQYYMNHWGDKRFIPSYNISSLSVKSDGNGNLLLSKNNDPDVIDRISGLRYIVIRSGENGNIQNLYRVESGTGDSVITLIRAKKLGVRTRSQQVTLQYNPSVDYQFIEPVVAGNESAWGQLDQLNVYAEGNIDAPGQRQFNGNPFGLVETSAAPVGFDAFGLPMAAKNLEELESKLAPAVAKNKDITETKETESVQEMPPIIPINSAFGLDFGAVDMSALQTAAVRTSTEDDEPTATMLNIIRRDESGKIVSENVPATPNNVSLARKQEVFFELNKRLRDILRKHGIDVGTLTNAEARMSLGGITDFDTANITAEGLLEMIRIAEGYEGEQALPEEFAHVALEMLGHEHPLVRRLLNALNNSQESLEEAYNGMYGEYEERYGAENRDKLVLEAAGKLVAKHLFMRQEIQSSPVKRLVHRVVDAIKSLFRKFRRDEIQNAIFDANQIASKVAREMLGGRLLDQMSLMNVRESGQFLAVSKDLNGKSDILSKLLKTEIKRLSIFKKRLGYQSKSKTTSAIQATEIQINKLKSAITNYKTEDAVVTYLSDSLSFLAATEKSLDDAVNSGRPVNSICQKLNTIRDTLFSFSKSIEDIREAIISKEIQDSADLTAIMDRVAGVLSKFYDKYNMLARTYFEEMLSSVYGEHGKTVTVGREKGRVISIHEMATKADRDISLASRWFHSLADCNDYVLRAIDDIVRDAKLRSRKRALNIRPRIETAISDLEKATGSRDQSFMFEMKRYDGKEWCGKLQDDGKLHKTGKYISKKASEKLSPAQKRFYDTMMSIKKDADKCLPESLVDDEKIIMMRKYTMDRFKDAEGAKGKAIVAWEGLRNRVMDMSDSIDYDYYEVTKDFEGNRVDMLPVKFLLKGKNESFDDMSDDVATSMMTYAGMAFEYDELNGVVNILENAKYMASQRDVAQYTGSRKQRESIGYKNNGEIDAESPGYFREPFTLKQASSNMQNALNDFFQMHVYGHIRKNEGTIGKTRLSKRKVVDTINTVTSYSQMAINIPQRIANINTGITQIMIESVGKGMFKAKDVRWASGIYLKESGDRLAETGKTDYDNKLSLWDEYFDIHQNNGRNNDRYAKGRMSRIFNSGLLYAGLTMGEDYLASTTSLALARNFKVKDPSGKETNLWEAYEVKYKDPTNKTGAYLSLKDGYTKPDGSPITVDDERKFSKLCAGMNFELQGIYNLDDRSAVQQYSFGALIIMYRKWIAPALKRRYAGVSYNLLKDDYQEGYHRTMFRLLGDMVKDAKDQVTEEKSAAALLNIIEDMKALKTALTLNWAKMTDYEKSNVHRSLTELCIVAGLWLSCALMGKVPPPEYGEKEAGAMLKWWDRTLLSQMMRLRTEIGSQAPTPMFVDEAMHILKSPFAAIAPLQNTINAINLLVPSNYWTEIKSGRYKGHSRAYKYFRELPIVSMFKKVDNFLDPSPLISYYKNSSIM